MPILLDNITASSPVKTYSPKFFDSKLTGSGKKVGMLNELRNPIHIPPTTTTPSESISLKKRKYTNGQTDVLLLPVNILTQDAWDLMHDINRPDLINMAKIATKTVSKNNVEVYLDMTVHSLVLEETAGQTSQGGITKKLTTCYQVFLYILTDLADTKCTRLDYIQNANKRSSFNVYFDDMTCSPLVSINNSCYELEKQGFTIDNQAAIDYITNYSLYSAMVNRSEEWQTTVDVTLDTFFENVSKYYYTSSSLNLVTQVLRQIEDYGVPLNLYKNIYQSVTKHFKPDDATILCKQNLNLLLSDTLNNLQKNKNILTTIQAPNPPVAIPTSVAKFSNEQLKAITTTDPLVLVQAGAGTGKSTVILGRMEYMIAAGVNPADITVLSFTNAAANNISLKNNKVHSMTIARMIHTIYSANFTNHELSSIDTIMNSLDIYYPDDEMAMTFKRKLKAIAKNDSDGFTSMNNFIEYNYAAVMEILDTIKQTSLELEIIICYQKIDTLIEPKEVASKYLIIDEVQDNSIFEFIYTLKYVDKHKESLFIVGDCSQTLYEFRASNPKALNVLEGSGVFTTYQLQVNYRSNQEILDFANVALQNIEANQYAHIQLQANSLSQVTEQSFTEKVTLDYHRLNKITEFKDALSSIMALNVKPYIDAKLAAGEQVAFLAFTRQHIYMMQNILEHMYPDKVVANLVPEKMYNSTIFSSFIKRFWNEVQFVPTQSIINIISQEVIGKLQYLVLYHEKVLPSCQRMLASWQNEQQALINNWQNQYMNGQMTKDDLLNNVRESMLQFEIRNNAIKQALLSARNEENKKNQDVDNANFVLSTIHSAKGLEFDNVVVLYRNESDLAEDKKRMYYVAFTRAMKSEYILAYDTAASPKIEADYKSIVEALHKKDLQNVQAATTVTNAKGANTKKDSNVAAITPSTDDINGDSDATGTDA